MNPSQTNNKTRTKVLIAIACGIVLFIAAGTVYSLTKNQNNDRPVTSDDSNLYLENNDIPKPPSKSERAVSAIIEDTDTKNSITATKLVINPFDLPKLYAVSDPARTVVLVEYTATSKGEYSGAPSGTKVDLVTADGTVIQSETFSDGEMDAANYKQMSQIGPKANTSITGYVAYLVPTEKVEGEFSIQYVRPKTAVVYGDDLPEKTFKTKLVISNI